MPAAGGAGEPEAAAAAAVQRDFQFGWAQALSCLVADVALFNSASVWDGRVKNTSLVGSAQAPVNQIWQWEVGDIATTKQQ